MKKLVILFALGLFTFSAYSQARFEIGLKGGVNLANIKGDDAGGNLDYENRTGFHAGAYTMIKFANIGIQPELLYSRKGSTIQQSFGGASEEFKNDLVYLDVPVMAKVYLPLGLNFQAGPQFGMLLSAESDGEDIKESYKNADVSVALGAGWDAPFGLRLTARYLIGLNDINDSGIDLEQKNRMIQLSLGYALFKVGK